jgi:hypothetical protein
MVLERKQILTPCVIFVFALFLGMCVEDLIDRTKANPYSLQVYQRMEDARKLRMSRKLDVPTLKQAPIK